MEHCASGACCALRALIQGRNVSDQTDIPQWLVPKQAAAMAGISVRALYERLRGPSPPPGTKRIGVKWLIPRDKFIVWLCQDRID